MNLISDALLIAVRFSKLLPEGIQNPWVTIDDTEKVAFDWENRDLSLTVILKPDDTAVYAALIPSLNPATPVEHGTVSLHEGMPEPISNILTRYFRRET